MRLPILNSAQTLHKQQNAQCRRRCAFPDCTNCLCGKRADCKACSAEHKNAINNLSQKKLFSQLHLNIAGNKKNFRVIERLALKGVTEISIEGLDFAGFDSTVEPVTIFLHGKKVAVYGKYVLWPLDDKTIRIEKLK